MGGRKKIRYTIAFTTWTPTGDDGWEVAMRLKGLLKVAGRRFGMRCVGMREEEVAPESMRKEAGKGERFVCPGWRSKEGQGRFW
jgi:hypothetical protein